MIINFLRFPWSSSFLVAAFAAPYCTPALMPNGASSSPSHLQLGHPRDPLPDGHLQAHAGPARRSCWPEAAGPGACVIRCLLPNEAKGTPTDVFLRFFFIVKNDSFIPSAQVVFSILILNFHLAEGKTMKVFGIALLDQGWLLLLLLLYFFFF